MLPANNGNIPELPSGEQVVVKVQYPHVDEVILGDLKNLKIFFKLFERQFQGKVDGDAMAAEFGAAGFVTKPVDRAKILKAVADVLGAGA